MMAEQNSVHQQKAAHNSHSVHTHLPSIPIAAITAVHNSPQDHPALKLLSHIEQLRAIIKEKDIELSKLKQEGFTLKQVS